MKKLGFGTMRLPLLDSKVETSIDMDQFCDMTDTFLERGYIYFDTAYFYHGKHSELAVREALVRRHPRESFLLADKLPITSLKKADADKQAAVFAEQFEKCGVDYFDYYLLHCLTKDNYETAKRLDTFRFLLEKKAEGKIRHLGFSFHDKADLLDRILTDHPEVEFVQLQINYLDWEDERVQSRKCYETAVRHGKKVIVMEPVKGGRLANVPEEVSDLFAQLHPDWSPASWAIRFAASLPEVMMVLSGMSNREQLLDNTGYMQDFQPIGQAERAALGKAAELISALPAVACTGCRYCVEGCPREIPIPDYFALYNRDQPALRQGQEPDRDAYRQLSEGQGLASACVNCHQCEIACPQHLPVTRHLQRVASTYE